MLKAASTMVKQPYSKCAGAILGDALVAKLGRHPDACWLFCEPGNGMEDLVAGVLESVGSKNLIGCTSDGEISNSGFSHGSAVLGGIASDTISFSIASASNISSDSERAGRELAQKLPSSARHVQLFSDSLTGNACAILRGFESRFGSRIPITGGTAGDGAKFVKTWQFAGNQILTDSAIAIAFSGSFRVGTGLRSGWFRVGVPKKVTRAHGNLLYRLDGEPAWQVYKRYLGSLSSQMPGVGAQFPLGIVQEDETLTHEGGAPVLRAIMGHNEHDGSLVLGGEITQGSSVVMCTGSTRDKILDASGDAARSAVNALGNSGPADVVFVYSCMARRKLLGMHTKEESERISQVVGNGTPMWGFYTYGEYCPAEADGPCRYHNETAILAVIKEREVSLKG